MMNSSGRSSIDDAYSLPAFRYGASLRDTPIETTLEQAEEIGRSLGITRVCDITRLDRIGIPVFASIRPGALNGAHCVNTGKGLTPIEARVGAWMESIECAMAEPGLSKAKICEAPVNELLFVPSYKNALSAPPAQVKCVECEDLTGGDPILVPKEYAGHSSEMKPPMAEALLASGAAGLAAGNSLLEATVHGLAEVIERSIRFHRTASEPSLLVPSESFPAEAAELLQLIRQAGLELSVRHQPNAYELPCFEAVLYDPSEDSIVYVNRGFGCHPHRSIALVRAICGAAQDRLSLIHGGRDDAKELFERSKRLGRDEHFNQMTRLLYQARRTDLFIDFQNIPDYSATTQRLCDCYDAMAAALARNDIKKIYRIRHSPPNEELQVVKIIVLSSARKFKKEVCES